jgi:hypothetical protein
MGLAVLSRHEQVLRREVGVAGQVYAQSPQANVIPSRLIECSTTGRMCDRVGDGPFSHFSFLLRPRITLVPYGCTEFRISMFPVSERVFELSGLKNPPGPSGK